MSTPAPEEAPVRSRPAAALRSAKALQPLGVPVFRLLWSTWLAANLSMCACPAWRAYSSIIFTSADRRGLP